MSIVKLSIQYVNLNRINRGDYLAITLLEYNWVPSKVRIRATVGRNPIVTNFGGPEDELGLEPS